MTAAVLLVGLSAAALGGLLTAPRRTFRAGLGLQAIGAADVPAAGWARGVLQGWVFEAYFRKHGVITSHISD